MPRFLLAAFTLLAFIGVRNEGRPAQPETPDRDLLSDSELFYEVSGGLAGVVRTARLVAKAGEVSAEYASSEMRPGTGPQKGALEHSRYLELWEEAERAGIWSIRISGKATGADLIRHELSARAGDRRHTVSWSDGSGSSATIESAVRIGERILAVAREVTTER